MHCVVSQPSAQLQIVFNFAGTGCHSPQTWETEGRWGTATAHRHLIRRDRKLGSSGDDLAWRRNRRTTAPDRLAPHASPFVLQAGTVIPAALITGIRSDLPGQITAQVTENVYDSPTGRARLIPQGARLIGNYDSQVAFGQSRVLLVWTRLIMPNGPLDCTGAAAGSGCRWLFRSRG